MPEKRTAVIEDMDAFMAYLATMPLIVSASSKRQGLPPPQQASKAAAPSAADQEFLDALKSMA